MDSQKADLNLLPVFDAVFKHRNVTKAGERSEEHTSELQSLTKLVCRRVQNPKRNQGR